MSEFRKDRISRLLVSAGRAFCLGDPNIRARLRSLHCRRVLQRSDPKRILDAGCGRSGELGWFGGIAPIAFPLSMQFPDALVVGLDQYEEITNHNRGCAAKGHLRNMVFETGTIQTARKYGTFDLVVFSDIARDAPRDSKLIQDAASLVALGGALVIICPTTWRAVWKNGLAWVPVETGFIPDRITGMLQASGFEVQHVSPIFRKWGASASLLYEGVSSLAFPLAVVLFPVLMTLALLDMHVGWATGEALIVVAARSVG